MKKLLYILMLIPALLSAQTYNVSITNSLLGPVTISYTNLTVQANAATVTGVSINVDSAVITGAVINAAITNSFAPINNITNVNNIGSTTVINSNQFFNTNIIAAGAVNITNITQYTGTFTQTIVTNNVSQFNGVNVFTPNVTDTNVSGTWTITLNTNAAVRQYTQVGNITQVTFSVTSTNDVALAEIILDGTTNSITWPTNKLVWAAGSAPTHTVSNNIFYFRAWRDYVQGVFVTGTTPP